MTAPWTILGVPIDSIGAPASGPPVGTERAPRALREQGVVARLGFSLGCYNPDKDPGGRSAAILCDLLVDVLGPTS
jgi:hypothetical protein